MSKASFGVALSGGAARGAAHLGVLRALRDLELHPDVVSGTSSGALVGSLWCRGLPEEEIRQAIIDFEPFAPWRASMLQPGLFNADYFKNYWSPFLVGALEDMNPRLLVVATDVFSGEPIIISRGHTLTAVQASCALPPLFPSVRVDDHLLFDGGLSLNLPVEPLRSWCNIVLAVDVNPTRTADESCTTSAWRLFNRGLEVVFNMATEGSRQLSDILLEPRGLEQFDPLDLGRMGEAEELGYRAALEGLRPLAPSLRNGLLPAGNNSLEPIRIGGRSPAHHPKPMRFARLRVPPPRPMPEPEPGVPGWVYGVGAIGLLAAGAYVAGRLSRNGA
ncbi:MAG: patatin-like phospholipase family protein [Myxococcota bacterium]